MVVAGTAAARTRFALESPPVAATTPRRDLETAVSYGQGAARRVLSHCDETIQPARITQSGGCWSVRRDRKFTRRATEASVMDLKQFCRLTERVINNYFDQVYAALINGNVRTTVADPVPSFPQTIVVTKTPRRRQSRQARCGSLMCLYRAMFRGVLCNIRLRHYALCLVLLGRLEMHQQCDVLTISPSNSPHGIEYRLGIYFKGSPGEWVTFLTASLAEACLTPT